MTDRKHVIIENAYVVTPTRQTKLHGKKYVWAGRDIPLKNVGLLKRAFLKAKEICPDIELVLLSGVSHDAVLKENNSAYALVLPSYSDDSPNFLLEGISAGVPFISTEFNGLRERIEVFGLFVNPRDETALRDAIIEMSDSARREIYANAIAKFSLKHTYDDIVSELSDKLLKS